MKESMKCLLGLFALWLTISILSEKGMALAEDMTDTIFNMMQEYIQEE